MDRNSISEPLAGVGVDRSQIRELLKLTPVERLHLAAADASALDRIDLDGLTVRDEIDASYVRHGADGLRRV